MDHDTDVTRASAPVDTPTPSSASGDGTSDGSTPPGEGTPIHPMTKLIDSFGRSIDYVRVSVTDRCDLRCSYCMPRKFHDFHEPEEWLSFNEIERVMAVFARLGTRRIRLTGGEPLVRKDLPQLAQRLAALPGIEDLSLSTNATRLDKYAVDLHAAGISRLNISLDSLHADTFKRITGGKLEKVLDGIMTAKAAGFRPVKINMVLMKGVNDHEVEDMVNFCIQHQLTLRFIETMPIGDSGHDATENFIDLAGKMKGFTITWKSRGD